MGLLGGGNTGVGRPRLVEHRNEEEDAVRPIEFEQGQHVAGQLRRLPAARILQADPLFGIGPCRDGPADARRHRICRRGGAALDAAGSVFAPDGGEGGEADALSDGVALPLPGACVDAPPDVPDDPPGDAAGP